MGICKNNFFWFLVTLFLLGPLVGCQQARIQNDVETNGHIVFMIGEPEYQTRQTLAVFFERHLASQGYTADFVVVPDEGAGMHDFAGLEAALAGADLLWLSVHRRGPRAEQLDAVRGYLDRGGSLIGVRTASHAFAPRGEVMPGHAAWLAFDPEILGGNYKGHHPKDQHPTIRIARDAAGHPVLQGVSGEFVSPGSLYKTTPLADTATPLMTGHLAGVRSEPVVWINRPRAGGRVFYTSLGHPGDFDHPAFRVLLRNAVSWALSE